MEIREIKNGGKIGKLKEDNEYVLDNKGNKFPRQHSKNSLNRKKRATEIIHKFFIDKYETCS